ncbi:hypothetical protein Lser_V15G34749 [Lactuca serriola]
MMAINTQNSTFLPLQEKIVHKNTTARVIELVILSLLVSLLIYRVVYFKDQGHYFPWVLALLCESMFTFTWILVMSTKWNQCSTKTYPERLLNSVNESEFPAVDVFVTTADAILEPSIITMNTVLSLLAVDFPSNKLALYLSDDGCSPLTYYSLIETIKFAKVWVPFCKKYNVQVRAPFRYFTPESMPLKDDSLEFQHEWKKMKNEYGDLYKKIEFASQRPIPCDRNSDFADFYNVHRSDHPTIIKIISENKEGNPNDLPHVIYISREKSSKHQHHYKAGAMNVLTRVSGVMTNSPLILNLDCDMYANNPQVFIHAMCMLFSFKNEEDAGFIQFPQAFYNGLKDDPFGNQLANFYYLANGISGIQGTFYAGSNCFHRRKVIYGSYPNDKIKTNKKDLHKIFGKSIELQESAAQILSSSNSKIESQRRPSSFIEAAIRVAGCSYEYGTMWGTQVGWMYGSTTEDVLTGLTIHGRGYRTVICTPDPPAFLGCAPTTYTSANTQQKRWAMGLLEILFTDKSPILLTIKGNLWFRQALAYLWLSSWAIRSFFELIYAALLSYCIITGSHFLPKVNEPAFLIPGGIFVIYNLYVLWEFRRINLSFRMWWNLQRMGRVNAMTAYTFAFVTVVLKLFGLSNIVFEVTQKEESNDDEDTSGRFVYDTSPVIVPGVAIMLVSLTALVSGMSRLGEVGFGEMVCNVWMILCFWEYFKGIFGNGKYRIPTSTIWKAGALALLFVQLCRRSS